MTALRLIDPLRRGALMLSACLLIAAGATGAPRAEDDAMAALRALFDAGEFLAVADEGERIGTAPALALAARALGTYGYHLASEEEREALYARAIGLGERAVALDPRDPQAHFQLAQAVGLHGDTIGVMEALGEGYAERMRDSIDAGLALAPADPFGHILLANWHAGILDAAGFFGAMIYGADEDDALTHFDRALAIAPESAMVRVSYAEAILKLDDDEHGSFARAQLRTAVAFTPDTALEQLFVKRGRTILDSWEWESES